MPASPSTASPIASANPCGEDLGRCSGPAGTGEGRPVEGVSRGRPAPVRPVQPVAVDVQIDRLGQPRPELLDIRTPPGAPAVRDLDPGPEDPAHATLRRALLCPVQMPPHGVHRHTDALLRPAVVGSVHDQIGQTGPVHPGPADATALAVAPVQESGAVGGQLLAGGDRAVGQDVALPAPVEVHRVDTAVATGEVTARLPEPAEGSMTGTPMVVQ